MLQKNSVSMAARSLFSHRELQGKKQNDMIAMMLGKDVDWNKYPKYFKEGSFFKRVSYLNDQQVNRHKVEEILQDISFLDLTAEEKVDLIFRR